MNSQRSIFFSFACVVGLVAAFIWLYLGEEWGLKGDAPHYVKLYDGLPSEEPFGFRILTPWLAQLFPGSLVTNFKIVAIASLTFATGVIYCITAQEKRTLSYSVVASIFWVTSFGFIYYVTTIIRPDSVMFLMMSLLFLVTIYNYSYLWLVLIISVGIAAHETILIFIAIVWINQIFKFESLISRNYKTGELLSITILALAIFLVIRNSVTVLPANQLNYFNSTMDMISYSLKYSGGMIKHLLRIYAAYGPVLIYSIAYLILLKKREAWVSFMLMLLTIGTATFFATDTLRIMAVVFIPIIIYAARFIDIIMNSFNKYIGITLVLLQVIYSYIVFGHLRSFEEVFSFQIAAGAISMFVAAICAALIYTQYALKKIDNNGILNC